MTQQLTAVTEWYADEIKIDRAWERRNVITNDMIELPWYPVFTTNLDTPWYRLQWMKVMYYILIIKNKNNW